jgi:hypothetical protein
MSSDSLSEIDDPKDVFMLSKSTDKLDGLRTYIDGKMRRYNLLFTVNGGIFAIAKLLSDPENEKILGGLTLQMLAVGAAAFTFLMCLDIWYWGDMMRRDFFGDTQVFGRPGRVILVSLGALLITGWLLAAFGRH